MGRGKRPNHRIEVRSEVIVTETNCDNAEWVGTATQTSNEDGLRSTVSTQTSDEHPPRAISTQTSDGHDEVNEMSEIDEVNEVNEMDLR